MTSQSNGMLAPLAPVETRAPAEPPTRSGRRPPTSEPGNVGPVSQTVPADTDPEVFQRQIDRWRSMSPIERARLADRLSADIAAIATAGILRDHPGATNREVRRELVRRRYGEDLAVAAYGVVPTA